MKVWKTCLRRFILGLPIMPTFLKAEERKFPRPPVGSAIQPTKIYPVTSFETEKLVATACWNDQPYAILRASLNYLLADFFLTLLLHLHAALSHVRARKCQDPRGIAGCRRPGDWGRDQSLTIITTPLRIAGIEYGGRLGGLDNVALADLVKEVGDLYEPIAEDKHITA